MRKRLKKLPSPAMAVAFVALLAALTGTAVALPGSNTVTSGDITNGAVKTQDIRNSTVRGRDVRNNTLTGSDISEGSLGTVPNASRAGAANTANAAGFANIAGLAGAVNGLATSGQAVADDGATATILTVGPWRFILDCDLAVGPEVQLENVSAGDDSHFSSDEEDDDDFNNGDVGEISDIGGVGDEPESDLFSAFSSNGRSAVYGIGMAVGEPDNYGAGNDCYGGVSVTAR